MTNNVIFIRGMSDIQGNFGNEIELQGLHLYVFYSIGLELQNSYLESLQLIGKNWPQQTLL